MRARAAELASELDGYQTDQFTNRDMVDGYRQLGAEILAQFPIASTRCACTSAPPVASSA